MLLIVSIFCTLLSFLQAQDISSELKSVKHKLLYEGKVTGSKKELESLYKKYQYAKDKKSLNEVLLLLGEYTDTSYRALFKMCRESGMDCSYYKARVLELDGNAGSAMELYLEGGYYDDYIRLKAYSGAELNVLAKKYDLKEESLLYYQGLVYIAKGEWDKAIDVLSDKKMHTDPKSVFYLGYAFLMKGQNDKATELLKQRPEDINYFQELEYKRLKALISYAENDQFTAFDGLKDILKYLPQDFLSKRYLAHIYYRTGWFNKAEQLYSELIKKEWRDTELYYLLSERCEMRIRNLKFDLAKKDAEKIIKEYPARKDFIAELVLVLLTYGDVNDAAYFTSKLSALGDAYEQSLKAFCKGLILEYERDYVAAIDMFKQAAALFPSKEYSSRVLLAEQDLKEMKADEAPRSLCKDYEVKKISERSFEVINKRSGLDAYSKYLINIEADGSYRIVLPVSFVYNHNRMYFNDKEKLWKDYIKKIWSVGNIKLNVQAGDYNKVNIVPWPSSFYLKRTSSQEWSLLAPPLVVAHEVGHLLGLYDEYYETDTRILSRNTGRYIGPMSSIMRNMYTGRPEKRHIHFILSPLQCY